VKDRALTALMRPATLKQASRFCSLTHLIFMTGGHSVAEGPASGARASIFEETS
jgi:hypothetical protein